MATKKAMKRAAPKAKAEAKRGPKAAQRPEWSEAAGTGLAARMEALGVSRKELGAAIGCTGSRIRELQMARSSKGPTAPSAALAKRLSRWLDAHPAPAAEKRSHHKKAAPPAEPEAEVEPELVEPEEATAIEGAELVGEAGDTGLTDEAPDPIEA
jgi:transcriptional regulator with XRE-family HTH domain